MLPGFSAHGCSCCSGRLDRSLPWPEQFGVLSYTIALVSIFLIFARLQLNIVVIRDLIKDLQIQRTRSWERHVSCNLSGIARHLRFCWSSLDLLHNPVLTKG